MLLCEQKFHCNLYWNKFLDGNNENDCRCYFRPFWSFLRDCNDILLPPQEKRNVEEKKKKKFWVIVMLLKCFCFRENTLVTLCFSFPSLFFSFFFFIRLELGQSGGVTIKINLPLRTSGCACLQLLPVGPHFSPTLKKIHLY